MNFVSTNHASWRSQPEALFCPDLPDPDDVVMPGIAWGCSSELFTPAFWKFHSKHFGANMPPDSFQLGRSLLEEVAVCLLGGHGLPAELGLAAFYRLRERKLLNPTVGQMELEEALSEPIEFRERTRRYRFPRQKAKFLWHALQTVDSLPIASSPRRLRDHLTTIPGIGPKTASWIVRNHLGSNEVAILDIHIWRAGVSMALFEPDSDPAKHYFELEDRFLEFCKAIDEPASLVDALMWDYMRRIGPTAHFKAKKSQLELTLCQ